MKIDKAKYKTQSEVLDILHLFDYPHNKQKLTYLRLGRTQIQRKKSGRTYQYKLKPELIYKLDWFYRKSRVYYTESGIAKLDLFFNKKKLENIEKEL